MEPSGASTVWHHWLAVAYALCPNVPVPGNTGGPAAVPAEACPGSRQWQRVWLRRVGLGDDIAEAVQIHFGVTYPISAPHLR
jgi:hypothetical protein